jgi:high-affinity iron transporter
MLLNAVILILQETLEAAFLISVLAAVCFMQRMKFTWLLCGLFAGAIFASVYALNLQTVSEWFDYVGQEVVNASLQGAMAVFMALFFMALPRPVRIAEGASQQAVSAKPQLATWIAAAIVMLAITREGSEIVLYLGGQIRQEQHLQAVLMGSGLGFGIGLSVGFLLFYGLLGLSPAWGWRAAGLLLALFAGNMLSQSVMQLTQADWLPATQALWDSSTWLPENSVLGQLLYALLGYEATPSGWFVLAYLLGFTAVIAVISWHRSARLTGKIPVGVP